MLQSAPHAPPAHARYGRDLSLSGSTRSAWTPGFPEKLSGFAVTLGCARQFERYNELFRSEAPEGRVLFGFRSNGTVLSLVLDVGAYTASATRRSARRRC
jgi:hypothetical protein